MEEEKGSLGGRRDLEANSRASQRDGGSSGGYSAAVPLREHTPRQRSAFLRSHGSPITAAPHSSTPTPPRYRRPVDPVATFSSLPYTHSIHSRVHASNCFNSHLRVEAQVTASSNESIEYKSRAALQLQYPHLPSPASSLTAAPLPSPSSRPKSSPQTLLSSSFMVPVLQNGCVSQFCLQPA